jgi:hypothetical protein
VRTNKAHPNIYLFVIAVLADGTEVGSTNSCEVRPAGAATGWGTDPCGTKH